MHDTTKLSRLITEAARDHEVRTRIRSDPESVFKEYGLSDPDIALLRQRDLGALAKHLPAEVFERLLDLLKTLGEAHICIPWPPSSITVTEITPASTPPGALPKSVRVKVTGTGFEARANLSFQHPSRTVNATTVSVTPGPSSSLIADVTFALGTQGSYNVVVTNTGGLSGTLSMGFTVTSS
ncbi:hypothetical protein [Sorangium sp. So ce426]|uniref:hypothetical protein n=1 Tax=unclassified Sorangium TaxID=2621164 RepID=UPI003F5C2A80